MTSETSEKTQEILGQLQMAEQNLQQYSQQKQQFQMQLVEIESALKEVDGAKETFKIVGNIMVNSDKAAVLEDLNKKKELLDIRVKTLEKQEEKIREKTKELQEEVLKDMKKE